MFENELNPVLEGVRFLRELLGNGGQADSAASGSGWSVEGEMSRGGMRGLLGGFWDKLIFGLVPSVT